MSVQSDEDDEYLAMVEGQRARALATIERVKAVLNDPGGPDSWSHTFEGQHSVFVHDIREALEPTPKGKP